MNSMNRIKDSDENIGDSSNCQNDVPNRRQSVSIKDRVNIFEKQIEELEQKRNSRNLFELTKKFGFQKYLSKDNSQFSQSCTPKNLEIMDFIREVDDLCQNYEKEIEFHKRKNSAFKKKANCQDQIEENGKVDKHSSPCDIISSCSNCYKSLKEIDEIKANLTLKDEEIKKLTEENEEMQKRFDDLNVHLNSMMVCLQTPDINENNLIQQEDFSSNFNLECIKSNFTSNYLTVISNPQSLPLSKEHIVSKQNIKIDYNSSANTETKQGEKQAEFRVILKELISENIFNEFISQNSLNINSLNKKLLNEADLLKFTNTIFIKGPNRNMTLSIYHEYTETIFLHIYFSFLKCKAQKNLNNKLEFSWVISEEEINNEVVMMTVEDIYSLFYDLNHNKNSKIQDRELFFESTFEKKSYSKDPDVFSLKSEILSNFNNKVRIYEDQIKQNLVRIVRTCKNHIHAGKLVYRNRIIYDYGKLYSKIKLCDNFANKNSFSLNRIISPNSITKNYKNDNKLIFTQSVDVTDTIDNLINFIKYYSEDIDSIVLKGESKSKERINKEFSTKKNGVELNLSSVGENVKNVPLSIILLNILTSNDLLKQIKSLTINNIKLEENDFSYLNNIIEFATNLTNLNLNDNFLGDSGLRSISEFMKLNQTLLSIHLCNNNITHNGAFYLSDVLLKNNSASYLYLGKNNISGMGLQSLVNIIINGNKSIRHLDLSENRLTVNDIIIISNLIIKNCSYFEGLDLSYNKLDSDSIHTLGLALRTNVFMKSLYLNAVGLCEDSIPYFFQHLIEANLHEIYLDNNSLGEVGGVLFANLLKSNISLRKISLRNTMLNSVSLICISHALELETAKGMIPLEAIDLEENKFDDNSIEILMKTCEIFHKKQINKSGSSSIQNDLKFPKVTFSNSDCISETSKEKIRKNNFQCLFLV